MSIYDKASLVLIPSGTKTSKVYSQKPTNGDGDFTFSRSTAATRVNASGNIEKETQNLFYQSNDFSSGYWNYRAGDSSTGGQSGYDGTNDAWLLSVNNGGWSVYQNYVMTGVYTFSIYVKAGTIDVIQIDLFSSSTTYSGQFNLTSGTDAGGGNTIDRTITDVGGGWYRVSLAANVSSTLYARIGSVSATGNFYIQDAQLEQGLVARDYIETTTTAIYGGITDNVPRLDYQGSCPALLLEPQRTNLLTQGEYFNSWSKTSASVTSNAATSPEGVQNASKLVEASGSSFHFILSTPTIASGSVTFSFYAKSAERTSVSAFLTQSGNNGANFDLSAGTATAQGTGNTASIESVGDGWYRCVVTNSGSAQVASQVRIGVQNGALDSYVGDGTSGVYIYGAQVEAGSYATSYIPTYGSAVTRNVDTTYIQNGMTSLNSVDSMTIYFEVDAELFDGSQRYSVLTDLTGSSNWIFLSYESNTSIRGYIRGNANTSWDFSWSSGVPSSGTIKAALVIPADGNAKIYGNGQLRTSYSGAVLVNGFDTIALGGTNGAAGRKQALKQFMIFPTALTDQEAIDLTTI